MATLFTKKQAMEGLPLIQDEALRKGVDLALWLYLDKHWSLKQAIKKASEKHNVKPKVGIERLMREAIPEEVFWERMNSVKPHKASSNSKEAAIRNQKMAKMDKESKTHVYDITKI